MLNINLLNEIVEHLHNIFPDDAKRVEGNFTVKGGAIDPFPVVSATQYFYIEGNSQNRGLWQNGSLDDLVDEEFEGSITPCLLPRDFLAVAQEIETFNSNHTASTVASESLGNYSVTNITTKSGNAASWKEAFGSRLNTWRKL